MEILAPTMTECRICDNAADNREFRAREMMFGTRQQFRYLECGACGCLQLLDPPADLSGYYPEGYYSFQAIGADQGIKRYLKRKRGVYALTGRGLLGRLLVWKYGAPAEAVWARQVNLRFSDAVLDVGCGMGQNLQQLATMGFRRLHGVDPYIERDHDYGNGVVIRRRELAEVQGVYDFVMMHHAFEHMPEPLAVLLQVQRLLEADRFLLLRMPVAQSHAWRTYGADWVQLDAPRHLVIYSVKAVQVLAERSGFVLEDVVYDSTGFQFWGSEQYRRDIPLTDARSVASGSGESLFTADELRAFDAEAAALNARGAGDQACFYLRKRREI